jgi:DNA polymerase-3 subunit delta
MKIAPRDIASLLKRPDPRFLVFFLYGQDQGLARERSIGLAHLFADNLDDPFAVTRLTGNQLSDDPALLRDEMDALPAFGGIRLVMVTGAGTEMLSAVKNCLTGLNPDARLIIRATDVNTRHALVTLCDKDTQCASMGCYPDNERSISDLARAVFAADNITVEPDGLSILTERLGADRQASRSELEKLALLAGPNGSLSRGDIEEALGDNAALMLDQLSVSLLAGDVKSFESHHARALREGTQPVMLVRHALRLFKTLAMIQALMRGGDGVSNAVAKARPPLHFTLKPVMTKTASKWSLHQSNDIIDRLIALETQIKSGAFQDARALVGQSLLGLCLRARAANR